MPQIPDQQLRDLISQTVKFDTLIIERAYFGEHGHGTHTNLRGYLPDHTVFTGHGQTDQEAVDALLADYNSHSATRIVASFKKHDPDTPVSQATE